MNLLHETEDAISISGHSFDQVIFIGSEVSGHECTWDQFCLMADEEYDDGFGAQEVASDLLIAFNDGVKMWRGEYDGSEWWNYSTPFCRPALSRPLTRLFTREIGWNTLEEINDENLQS